MPRRPTRWLAPVVLGALLLTACTPDHPADQPDTPQSTATSQHPDENGPGVVPAGTDDTAPVTQWHTPVDGATVQGGEVELTGSVRDTGSGVAAVDVLLDGAPATTATLGSPASDGSSPFIAHVTVTPGPHVLSVSTRDRAGNSTTDDRNVTVETAATTSTGKSKGHDLLGTSPAGAGSTAAPADVATPSGSPVVVAKPVNPAETTPTADKTPAAGPAATPSLDPTPGPAAPDTTGPSVALRTPADGSTIDMSTTGGVNIAGTVRDESAVTLEVHLDGTSIGAVPLTRNGQSLTFDTWAVPSDGPHTVLVRARDAAGNATTVTRHITVTSPGYFIPMPQLANAGSDAVSAALTALTPTTMTLHRSSAPVASGAVIALGVTPLTPNGALRVVTSVAVAGDTVTLTTRPAALTEAFYELHLDQVVPLAAAPAARSAKVAQAGGEADLSVSTEVSASLEKQLCTDSRAHTVRCDSSDKVATVTASGEVTFDATSGLDIDLDISGGHVERFSTTTSNENGVHAHAQVDGALDWESDESRRLFHSPTKTIMAGYVPIIVQAEAELTSKIRYKVDATSSITADATGALEIGVEYTHDNGWAGVADAEFNAEAQAGASVSGEVSVKLGLQVMLQFYELAGPALNGNVTPILYGGLSTESSPGIGVDVLAEAGAGVQGRFLDRDLGYWGKEDIYSHRFNIAYLGGHTYLPLDGEPVAVSPHPTRNELRAEFTATGGDRVRLVLDGPDPAAATIELNGPQHNEPGFELVDGQLEFVAPATGRYTIGYRFDGDLVDKGRLAGAVVPSFPLRSDGPAPVRDLADGLGVTYLTFRTAAGDDWTLTLTPDSLPPEWAGANVTVTDASGATVTTGRLGAAGTPTVLTGETLLASALTVRISAAPVTSGEVTAALHLEAVAGPCPHQTTIPTDGTPVRFTADCVKTAMFFNGAEGQEFDVELSARTPAGDPWAVAVSFATPDYKGEVGADLTAPSGQASSFAHLIRHGGRNSLWLDNLVAGVTYTFTLTPVARPAAQVVTEGQQFTLRTGVPDHNGRPSTLSVATIDAHKGDMIMLDYVDDSPAMDVVTEVHLGPEWWFLVWKQPADVPGHDGRQEVQHDGPLDIVLHDPLGLGKQATLVVTLHEVANRDATVPLDGTPVKISAAEWDGTRLHFPDARDGEEIEVTFTLDSFVGGAPIMYLIWRDPELYERWNSWSTETIGRTFTFRGPAGVTDGYEVRFRPGDIGDEFTGTVTAVRVPAAPEGS